jgi:hypothetical protein
MGYLWSRLRLQSLADNEVSGSNIAARESWKRSIGRFVIRDVAPDAGFDPRLSYPKKGFCMKKGRFAKRVAVVVGFLFPFAMPALSQAPSQPLSPAQIPHVAAHVARPAHSSHAEDELAGLTFTEDQKAKIDQIHQNMKPRMDVVVKDPTSSAVQKRAMLEGLARMERRQVFQLLTPEQQSEVRNKVLARRAAERKQNKQNPQSQPNLPSAAGIHPATESSGATKGLNP